MKLTIDLEQLADFLGQALGRHTEVVIHDLTDLAHSLAVIRNGHITRREVGAPATDLTLRMARDCLQSRGAPFRTNYTGKTVDGRALRSSSLVIQDLAGKPVAMICFNSDDSHFNAALDAVRTLLPVCSDDKGEELFSNSIEHVGEQLLTDVIASYPVAPVKMSADEKKEVVQRLDQSGVFLVKGFIARAAQMLGISEPTLYRYLKA
ncbi:hypothetical protein JHS3_23470 [Jeongeupia sp. HS-3]|uniref:helix-turn-helix transcriptional regulator n=1 Tax=Jeongeupia sp. HS-3 TaxID=1009682 RepID=UPI0018A659DC|nr:PAS domain-containing protein [Jeongeupia sp. HS-3]BCL76611.1 hypothetical protein JHS3_23470 [Jeongeupia sp. HS-3]